MSLSSTAKDRAELPLKGITVVDFSRVLAGPLATMTLGDLGARVIKVERPKAGDDTRDWGPPYSPTGTTYFESVNRNKESVCLDLNLESDRDIARNLVRHADILVENFRPGGMQKFGLDYEEVSKSNPKLIYASITGFGSEGGALLPGYDFIVQALGGLMSITGESDGPPLKVGVALVDVLAAKDATIAILAALQQRQLTGRGCRVEAALLTSMLSAMVNQGQAFLGAGEVPVRMANEHPSIVPYQLLECKDRSLAVACGNDGQFDRLTDIIGRPELAVDKRFMVNSARVENRVALIPLLEDALREQPADHWDQKLTQAKVPCGSVLNIDESIEYADSLGLEPAIEVVDRNGSVTGRQIRYPVIWEPGFEQPNEAPPALGEHTEQVLEWLRTEPLPGDKP